MKFILTLLLPLFLFANQVSVLNDNEKFADEFTQSLGKALWNLDTQTVEDIIKDNILNENFLAVVVTDVLVNKTYVGYKKDKNVIFLQDADLPDGFNNFNNIKIDKKLVYNTKHLANVSLYFKNVANDIFLTNEEINFLNKHRTFKLGVDMFYPPFEFINKDGKYKGIAKDYLNIISEKLGIKFEVVPNLTWIEVLENAKNKKLDILPILTNTPQRSEYLLFTDDYVKIPQAIIARDDTEKIENFKDIKDKTLAVTKGYVDAELLPKKYPNLKIVEVDTLIDALKDIQTGKIDYAYGNLAVLNYYIKENSYNNIQVLSMPDDLTYSHAMGVRKDWPELKSILNKAIKSISFEETNKIKTKWIGNEVFKQLDDNTKISFTSSEKDWIKNKKVLKVHAEADWKPFNYIENNKALGYSNEYMRLLAKTIGIDIEFVKGPTWNEYMDKLLNKQLDIISSMTVTEKRKKDYIFSEKMLLGAYIAIFSKKENSFKNMEDLSNKKVALLKGTETDDIIKSKYPNIEIVYVNSNLEKIELILGGKVDATIGNAQVLEYLVSSNNIKDIISAPLINEDFKLVPQHLGMNKDEVILKSIVDKAMNAIDPFVLNSLRLQYGLKVEDKLNDSTNLTFEEKDWVSKNVVVLGAEHWAPVSFSNDGTDLDGITGDVIKLLEERVGLKFKIKNDLWNNLLNDFKQKKIDLLPVTYYTDERANFGIFSKPYYKMLEFLYVKEKNNSINSFEDLKGKTLAIPKGYGTIDKIKKLIPQINILETVDIQDSIQQVLSGNADALYDGQLAVEYELKRNLIDGIKAIPQNTFKASDLHFFSNIDKPILASILQKGLDSITYEEFQKITSRWIGENKSINLNKDEEAWLENNKYLTYSYNLNNAPFEWKNNFGEHSGIVADLLKIVSIKSGVNFLNTPTKSKTESLDLVNLNKAQIISFMDANTNTQNLPVNLTKRSLYKTPYVVVVRENDNDSYFEGHEVLMKKRVAAVDKYYLKQQIKEHKPEFRLSYFETFQKAVESLTNNYVDAIIVDAITAQYAIKRLGYEDIKIVSKTDLNLDMRIAVSKNIPDEALTIIDKSLRLITPNEIDNIVSKYVAIEVKTKVDWALIFQISTVFLIAAVFLFYQNRKLNRSKLVAEVAKARAEKSQKQLKQVLDKVTSQEKFVRTLLDSQEQIILTTDGIEIKSVNKRFLDFFGLSSLEEFKKQNNCICEKFDEDSPDNFIHVMNEGKLWIDYILDYPFGIHKVQITQNEIKNIFNVNVSVLSEEEVCLVVLSDITELEHIKQEIEESQAQLKLAYEVANLGLWDWDLDTDTYNTNEIWDKMLGYRPYSVDNRVDKWKDIIHPDEKENVFKELNSHIYGKTEMFNIQQRLKTGSGEYIWIDNYGKVVERDEDGKPTRLIGVLIDINETKNIEQELLKAKEKADEATVAKSNFLANMSHEIRTPMNAVIGLTDLALKTELNKKQRDYLTKVQTSALSLLGIINDILDFSKIEAGKLNLEKIPFSLDEVLDNIVTVVQVKTQQKGVELLFLREPGIHTHFIGDPLRLGQVLINLANNAAKFTEKGNILLTINKIIEDDENMNLEFCVKDTGIGMTQEQVSRLFQSFTQADNSTSRKYGGSGLGLAISKQIVEMMNGNISVQSEFGVGSTFKFNIVLQKDNSVTEDKKIIPEFLRKMPVLIVDDSELSVDVLKSNLVQYGFSVDSCNSAEDAINKIKNAKIPYELVFLDYFMGAGMTGLDATIEIKSKLQLQKVPKIILVTSHSHDELDGELGENLLDNILYKPVNPSTIFDGIMETFGYVDESVKKHKLQDRQFDYEDLKPIIGAKLLLVEDNHINQQVAHEILTEAKFFVDIANNGQEALDKLEQKEYDCILMDIHMPVMDGYTATRKIREQDKYKELPVLAMTANVMAEDKEKVLEIGMNAHLSKPINPKELFGTLLKWIKPGNREVPVLDYSEDNNSIAFDFSGLNTLDVEHALSRFKNKKLFVKLLNDFYNEHKNDIDGLKEAISNNDYEVIERISHTVKSIALTIGAEKLGIAARDVEMSIKEGTYNKLHEQFIVLENEFRPVLFNIYEEIVLKKQELNENKDVKELSVLIDELKVMLEDMDVSSEEKLEEIIESYSKELDISLVKELKFSLEDYEFEKALEVLEKIVIK